MLSENTYLTLYRSFFNNFEKDFMQPSYAKSVFFERGSGYFSLKSLVISIDGIVKFASNGGTIHLVCNPELSSSDITVIALGNSIPTDKITENILKVIEQEEGLSDEETKGLDIICNLIAEKRLIIKIAYMPNGIYHEKLGIFTDEVNDKVYYTGSANETQNAKLNNFESFTVRCSWASNSDYIAVENESTYFKALWNNEIPHLTVYEFPEALKNHLFSKYRKSSSLEKAIDEYIAVKVNSGTKELYEYQRRAIDEFLENNNCHFYEMATGTGKTFTSVKTITKLKEKLHRPLFTIICVPQVDLQVQWKKALEEEAFENIYLLGGEGVGGSHVNSAFDSALIKYYAEEKDVVCVAIDVTLFGKVVDNCIDIEDLFIIVDEAHNLTPSQMKKMPKNARYKLGLSATIQRFSEKETQSIIDFFTEGRVNPFVFSIDEAIGKFLSPYLYYPVFVNLSEDEFESYQTYTKSIGVEMNKEEPDQEKINMLCRERSRIVKQSSNKLTQLQDMMNEYDFNNSVVYCGQGKDVETEETIINSVSKILDANGYIVSQFTSKTEDRARVLYEFENDFYDTLVAIKCFDEGVDVPKLDKIYIMASDTALRQTVQRRGRVLRKCKERNKQIAYIYDMVALPPEGTSYYDVGAKALIANEFKRALEYCRLANNKTDIERSLQEYINNFNITEEELQDETESN